MSKQIPRFIFLFFLMACGVDQPTQEIKVATPFFDLEAYFSQQIKHLNEEQPKIVKKVRIGENTEEKAISKVDFEKELQIFRRSDINRPAWADKYAIDSTFTSGKLQAIQYTAKDTSLTTRLLYVGFQEGAVDAIRINNRTYSAIASTEQNLLYRAEAGYRIESIQETIGSDAKQVLIEVELD